MYLLDTPVVITGDVVGEIVLEEEIRLKIENVGSAVGGHVHHLRRCVGVP